jgi:hypothetical protein
MSRLTWDDLLVQDITPEQFRDWLSPWTGVVTGRVAPAFMSKFGFWFLRRSAFSRGTDENHARTI